MRRDDGRERIGLEARLYWGARLLESAVIDRGEVRLVDRDGSRPAYDRRAREGLALARIVDGHAIVTAPPGLAVEVTRGEGERWRGPAAELGPAAVARIVDGPLVHEFRRVAPPAAAAAGFGPGLDLAFARRLAVVALAAAAVVGAAFVISLEDPGLADRVLPPKFLRIVAALPPPARRPPQVIHRPALPDFRRRVADAGPVAGEGDRRERNGRLVGNTGLLEALHGLDGGGEVFSANIGAGINQAVNDLRTGGDGAADLHGLAAMGPRGGPGLPGGDLGLPGLTGGPGRGGSEPFRLRPGGERQAVRINPGKVTVVGGLAKEVIGRTIRGMQRQVVACYERELQKDPALEGKLAVSFVIDGTGGVAEVTVVDDSLGTPAVADCVRTKILRWRFPAPEGGGQVIVHYPWIFRAAGAE